MIHCIITIFNGVPFQQSLHSAIHPFLQYQSRNNGTQMIWLPAQVRACSLLLGSSLPCLILSTRQELESPKRRAPSTSVRDCIHQVPWGRNSTLPVSGTSPGCCAGRLLKGRVSMVPEFIFCTSWLETTLTVSFQFLQPVLPTMMDYTLELWTRTTPSPLKLTLLQWWEFIQQLFPSRALGIVSMKIQFSLGMEKAMEMLITREVKCPSWKASDSR